VEPDVPTRRIGNVVWRGVPLRDLLREAGPRADAKHVWLEGADHGTFANVHSERYVKDVPLETILEGDVLLAYELNDAPLSPEHGFPVRAVVPGWFGTNSVKWLTRIYLAGTRPESLFTTRLYNRKVVVNGQTTLEPVRAVDVHSVMVQPSHDDILAAGPRHVVGWAWSAHGVERVEVSTDGGASWADATLDRGEHRYAWQRFVFGWQALRPGRYGLQCRATDTRQRVQPAGSGRNRIHAISVTVA
jgi:DMSO/TMAO reductase YedYZ molybdopterin-dependent catalytic subunit